jgi:hypothetical protein
MRREEKKIKEREDDALSVRAMSGSMTQNMRAMCSTRSCVPYDVSDHWALHPKTWCVRGVITCDVLGHSIFKHARNMVLIGAFETSVNICRFIRCHIWTVFFIVTAVKTSYLTSVYFLVSLKCPACKDFLSVVFLCPQCHHMAANSGHISLNTQGL